MTQQYANVSEVPLALAVFLASDTYDTNPDPKTISATTLMKPLRQIILTPRIPPGEALPRLGDMMKNRIGAAIHDGIERAWTKNHAGALKALGYPKGMIAKVKINPKMDDHFPGMIPVYLEQRLSKTVGAWTVTGKFDFVLDGKVQDFKTTSTFTYKKQVNSTKYVQQGSIYRWLDPELINKTKMEIHYIFTDWKQGLVKTDPGYPPNMWLTQHYDLMGLGETNQFVTNKLALIDKYWNAAEADIPYCDDEDLWRSDPQFKYYKNGDINSKRSTKNFNTKQEAVIFMSTSGGVGAIKEVPGQVMACKYCSAFSACSQKDQLILNGELVFN